MTISIVQANSVRSLTDYVLREVKDHNQAWPRQRGLIIVPEYRKLSIERRYLEMEGTDNLMMSEVLSFNRLVYRLLDALGVITNDTLLPEGAAMLLRDILYNQRDKLSYFGVLRQNRRFLLEIEMIIGEMTRYGISAEQLERLEPTNETTRRKLLDTASIMRSRKRILRERGLMDSQSWMELACDRLDLAFDRDGGFKSSAGPTKTMRNRLAWLKRTHVWVTGFGENRNFTPLELSLLERLGRICRSLTITIVGTEFETKPAPDILHEQDAGQRTLLTLKRLFPRHDMIHLSPPVRPTERTDSNQLSDRVGTDGFPFAQLLECEDSLTASQWTAGKIRKLVEKGDYRYRDFAVAVANEQDYLPALKSTFRQAGVPLFLDEQRPLTHSPIGRMLNGALDLCLNGFTLDNVMGYLRCGLFEVEKESLDRFENLCLAAGLEHGYLFEDERFAVLKNNEPVPCAEELALRQVYVDPVRSLAGALRQPAPAARLCEHLRRLIDVVNVGELTDRLSEDLQKKNKMDDALLIVRSWNGVTDLLEQLELICGRQTMRLTEFRQIIRSGLDNLDAAVIPTSIDQVLAGPPERVLGGFPAVLFVLGAEDGSFPSAEYSEGLLKDTERTFLSEALSLDFPSVFRQKPSNDRFLVDQLTRLPEDRLYLLWQNEKRAASICMELAQTRETEKIAKEITSPFDVRLYSPVLARSRLLSLPEHLGPMTEDTLEDWRRVAVRCRDSDEAAYDDALRKMDSPHDIGPRQVLIEPDIVGGIFGTVARSGVTALEQYMGCSYAYFLRHVLGARERDEFDLRFSELGDFLHKVMEIAFARLMIEPDLRSEVLRDSKCFQGWIAELVSQAAADPAFEKAFSRPENRTSFGRRAGKIALYSLYGQVAESLTEGRLPVELEWKFGQDADARLDIGSTTLRMNLTGIVDRVDKLLDEPDKAFFVLDYKSGKKKVDDSMLWHGFDLQLPLYLQAWKNAHPHEIPGGAGYRKLSQQILTTRPDPAAPSDALIKSDGSDIALSTKGLSRLMRRAMSKATHCLESIAAGQFSINPSRPETSDYNPCRYCLAKGACGIESTEVEVELLQDVKQLAQMGEADSAADDRTDQTGRDAESQSPLEFLLQRDDERSKIEQEEAGG